VSILCQAPLAATVYELDRFRCNLCGDVFTAPEPEGIGAEKYDETTAAMIALLKYGSGMPFYRLEKLEQLLGIPLPASTQWEINPRSSGRCARTSWGHELDRYLRLPCQGQIRGSRKKRKDPRRRPPLPRQQAHLPFRWRARSKHSGRADPILSAPPPEK
jgi:hypothetical protein